MEYSIELAVACGVITGALHQRTMKQVGESLVDNRPLKDISPDDPGQRLAEIDLKLAQHRQRVFHRVEKDGVLFETFKRNPRRGFSLTGFSRIEGAQIGINLPGATHILLNPFSFGASIAAGDVHQDGWVDLLMPSGNSLVLYANINGEVFIRQLVAVPSNTGPFINAGLVDLNNDGWLDIYATTYGDDNWILYNRKGSFEQEWRVRIDNRDENVTLAIAFADMDADGELEIANGNWHTGIEYPGRGKARNYLLDWQDTDDAWVSQQLSPRNGQTFSILLADINADKRTDLIAANDGVVADTLFMGQQGGGLLEILRGYPILRATPGSTMSFDVADIDRDGTLEVLLAAVGDVSQGKRSPARVCQDLHGDYFQQCLDTAMIRDVIAPQAGISGDLLQGLEACKNLADEDLRTRCRTILVVRQAVSVEGDVRLCDTLVSTPLALEVCKRSFPVPLKLPRKEDALGIRSQEEGNVLLTLRNNRLVDVTDQYGLRQTGWSWNTRFVDLDMDGFEDLFSVTGWVGNPDWETNRFFQNRHGSFFVERTVDYGLEDYLPVSSFVAVDLDNDTDLDLITRSPLGPVVLYRNVGAGRTGLTVELRDEHGNRYGIGSRITVEQNDGGVQIRQILASGGFMSADAPIVHFGTSFDREVRRLLIQRSTGEQTIIDGPLATNRHYRVTRSLLALSAEISSPR